MINKKDECHVKKCIPSIIPITLELLPKIKMCISKPEIHLVNNAICKPFKSKSKLTMWLSFETALILL